MKKSKLTITTAVAGALAVSVAGCGQPSYQSSGPDWSKRSACVDKRTNKRIADRFCRGGGTGHYGMYYFNRGQTIPAYGSTVRRGAGSYNRSTVARSYPKSNVSRGIAGSSARSYGSASS